MWARGLHTIAWSADGTNWFGLGNGIFQVQGVDVIYNPSTNLFVAVGAGDPQVASNTLAYSKDCVNWIGSGDSIFDGQGQSVAYSATQIRFVAVGGDRNTIAWSI